MKKFITSLQLEKRNIFILIVIISIFSIIGGIIFYQAELKSIKKDKHEEIRAIANLKSNQISNWYKDHHDDADVIAKSEMLLTFTKNYLKNESKADSENIYKYVIRRQIEHEYQAVILTNTYGDVIVSTDQNIAEIDSITKYFINEVINNKKVISTDLYRCKLHDELQIDFIAPIMENNSVLATIIFRVKPEDFLYPLITSWPTASNTSETLLLRKEGENVVFLNELRHQKNTSLKLNYSLKDTLVPAVQVVLGRKGIFEGLDYRGVDVLAYLTSIPNTPWFMVAKVDKSEIYSELNFRAIVIALFILFLIAITSIGLFWFYHYKQRNLYRELHSTQEEFKTTLYSIGDAVITTDKKGRVKHLNPVAEALTGWKEKDAVDWKLEKVFNIINEETRKQVESPVQKVLREGLVVGLANHTILISKDKREIPIADSGAPIKNEKGEIIGVVLVFRDQTDERMNQKLIYTRIKLNEYSYNHTLEELLTKTLDEVEYITKSKIGFYHFVEDDQETLSLQAWSTRTQKEFCKAEGKGLHYNVNEAGVWIDAIHQKKAVIHNDYKLLSHKKGMPEGHAEVIRELVVPIIRNNKIVAILGVGNKETDYNDKDIEIVSFLADVAWEIVTKKRMDLQILESKNYLNDLIDSAPFGSHNYELDKNGKLIFIGANKAANEILKIEHAQFVGKTIEEVFPSLAETEIPNAYKNVIQTGKKYNLEQIAYDDNKNIHGVFEVHGVKVAENRMTVFFRDITEKKKADEVIRLASLRWETTFNTISNPVALLGEDGTILQCNDAFIKFAKKDLNEIINQKCHTIIHLQNEHIENCPFIRSQSTLKREEMELEVDQKIFNVAIDPIMNSNGKFAGAVHIMEDITEIKQKEKEIFHLNRLYAMLSQTNQAIVRLNNSEDLFKEICKDAVEYGKFNLAWIGLFDVMKNKIVPKTYFGNEDGFITYELSKAPEEQLKLMPCFRAFYEKQTVVKNNVELDPDCEYWRPSALKRGFKSLAATPIYLNGKSTGVFVLYSSEPNFFGEKEIELLKEVGIDISFALDNYAKEELRKATEKMLEINESRFRIISEKTGTIIYDRNLITGKVHREGAIEEILGYSRAEYCNFSVEQYNSLLHEDERDSIIRKEDDLIN
jgi:PAS domain S-box-containing protein